MTGQKVLIIDDDKNSVRFLELELNHEGYIVEKEYDGFSGLERALTEKFDIILLDIMLPSMDGMEVLRRFRNASKTPVIMLTAKDAVADKVSGLDGGANDYLTKPFAIEELLARMRLALKKAEPPEPPQILMAGKLVVDVAKRSVSYAGEPIYLTKREFDLLFYLLKNHDMVCSRDRLMEQVWGYNFKGKTNLVDVYIRYLRNKIDYRYHVELIRTIRGVGYIINLNEKNEPVKKIRW
ncbi:response regulator transcription factor [Caproiciproducens galactitolivorans]|uniref:Stage 0 sporulation protein A homolog n=1 Tax=Caproiciproducens galactitolivorans TaxID=642589 RepID=A0A4Z0XZI4_9FIRM|nr:response regulator transcription factor [Caproiciproducens galactitolivorans]QEY34792.1 response regulator transcription factor [Caproiciproducens galactitolivorans]TGJ75957.1 response regulator ArlR [Caproiciproducens galactitolivorans]